MKVGREENPHFTSDYAKIRRMWREVQHHGIRITAVATQGDEDPGCIQTVDIRLTVFFFLI